MSRITSSHHLSVNHLAAVKTRVDEILVGLDGAKAHLDERYSTAIRLWKSVSGHTQLPEDELTQNKLSALIDKAHFDRHKEAIQVNPNKLNSLLASNGSCFHLIPKYENVAKLSDDDFTGMVVAYLQLFLNAPNPSARIIRDICPEAAKNPDRYHSTVCCARCGENTPRHNEVAAVCAEFFRDSAKHARAEAKPDKYPIIDPKGKSHKPGDVVISRPNGSHRSLYLDFHIVDPISHSRSSSQLTLDQVFQQSIKAKKDKYAAVFRGANDKDFDPIVCAAFGRVAPDSVKVLRPLVDKKQISSMLKQMSFYILQFSGRTLMHFYRRHFGQ